MHTLTGNLSGAEPGRTAPEKTGLVSVEPESLHGLGNLGVALPTHQAQVKHALTAAAAVAVVAAVAIAVDASVVAAAVAVVVHKSPRKKERKDGNGVQVEQVFPSTQSVAGLMFGRRWREMWERAWCVGKRVQ